MPENLDFVAILFRWMHILAAITAVGGTIFMRVAYVPASEALPDSERAALAGGIRQRWAKVVMACIGFLLISGIYNIVMIMKSKVLPESVTGFYHALFGIKFLLAMVIFFIASAMVGRSPALEKMRQNPRRWLTINMTLAIILVCISGVLRLTRDAVMQGPPPATPVVEQGTE